jgi:hypothetical protein
MKIQLDTTKKIIKIEETVNIDELIKLLKKLLPDGLWKEFKIETQTITNWTSPIYIERWEPYTPWPWYNPVIYCDGTSANPLNSQVGIIKSAVATGVEGINVSPSTSKGYVNGDIINTSTSYKNDVPQTETTFLAVKENLVDGIYNVEV